MNPVGQQAKAPAIVKSMAMWKLNQCSAALFFGNTLWGFGYWVEEVIAGMIGWLVERDCVH